MVLEVQGVPLQEGIRTDENRLRLARLVPKNHDASRKELEGRLPEADRRNLRLDENSS